MLASYGDVRQKAVVPSEEEIWLILAAAGKHKKNCIDASEIQFALDLWHSYLSNRDKINAVFEKYDTNHTERLEVPKLTNYLTDLNDGHPPTVTLATLTSKQNKSNRHRPAHATRTGRWSGNRPQRA